MNNKLAKMSKNPTKNALFDKSTVPDNFFLLYNFFTSETRQNLYEVFYNSMRVLHFKYKRKKNEREIKRKKKKKPLRHSYPLKRTDISKVVVLIDHFLANTYIIPPEEDPLRNFGIFPHDEGMKYYQHFVEGTVKDIYGNEIVIDEEGLTFLFDDHDKDLSREKYLEHRGKRLPWIRLTLKNTKGIYEYTETPWTTYFYVSKYNVPYKKDGILKKEPNYFFVVVRKKAAKPLKFVTAYHFDKKHMFLKYLEPSHPYTGLQS